jgi:hypothetical protein
VALSVNSHNLLLSSRYIRSLNLNNPLILLIILVAAVIALLYWFFGTEMGCSLRATGANTNMARAQGINTDFAKVLALVVSNGLVALSGALIAQYQGSATIDMGRGAIVIGLAAVIIGEVLFSKCFINFALKLLAAVIGAIIYYMVISLVMRSSADSRGSGVPAVINRNNALPPFSHHLCGQEMPLLIILLSGAKSFTFRQNSCTFWSREHSAGYGTCHQLKPGRKEACLQGDALARQVGDRRAVEGQTSGGQDIIAQQAN